MTTLGIVGGGQLGRMLALAAAPLDVSCIVVEPADEPPARVAAPVVQAPFHDLGALRGCDAVTVELEAVPVDALRRLTVPVRPHPDAIEIAQDRLLEKRHLRALGIRVAPFAEPGGDIGLPGFVKTRLGGFDGRGQVRVAADAEITAATERFAGRPCIVESEVAFTRELSIVGARSLAGDIRCWPVVENVHVDGILHTSRAPAPGCTAALQAEAESILRRFVESTGYVGVVAIELFDAPGGLVANEIAPRVHNSGHWTIEGSVTSQFEQHVRAVLGWPLGDVTTIGPSAMVNIVGRAPRSLPDLLAIPGLHLHLYGKAPRPQRKLGHLTVVAPDDAALSERIVAAVALLS